MSPLLGNPKMRDLPIENAIRDTIELTEILGCPYLFQQREAVLDVKDWRAELPCDFVDVVQLMLEEEGHAVRPKVVIEPNMRGMSYGHVPRGGYGMGVFKLATGTFEPVGAETMTDSP